MAGWDTDTNAGDVGPVMGIVLGPGAISEKWTKPIENTFRSDAKGQRSGRSMSWRGARPPRER